MNSVLRITTFIFFLLALSTLTGMTGIAQTTAALVAVGGAVPCCPHEKSSDAIPSDLPGCTLDCHCSACQGIELPQQFLFLKTALEVQLQFHSPLSSSPAGHGQSIDYPPETA